LKINGCRDEVNKTILTHKSENLNGTAYLSGCGRKPAKLGLIMMEGQFSVDSEVSDTNITADMMT